MSAQIVFPPPKPRGFMRLGFRLPLVFYRVHLGWLFGHRLLLLTHRGRRSGRVYRTTVEVVRYDAATRESIVAVGFGPTSDWYQNIQAQSALEVRTGLQRYTPRQRILTPDQVYAELTTYERRHPLAARMLFRPLYHYDGSEAARRELAAHLPMVAFLPSR